MSENQAIRVVVSIFHKKNAFNINLDTFMWLCESGGDNAPKQATLSFQGYFPILVGRITTSGPNVEVRFTSNGYQ